MLPNKNHICLLPASTSDCSITIFILGCHHRRLHIFADCTPGVWVFKSQSRTVVSPEPLANCCPSGLKTTDVGVQGGDNHGQNVQDIDWGSESNAYMATLRDQIATQLYANAST